MDARLEFEVPGEFLGGEVALAPAERERCVERVVDFLHKRDDVRDVRIAEAAPRVAVLELIDEPARVVDSDEEIVAAVAEEGAGQFAEFAGLRAGEARELPASLAADEAILQRDAAARVGAFEQARDV